MSITDEAGGTSDEDGGCEEMEAANSQESPANRVGDNELKEMLMRKYSGYLSSLRKEFLKKRKKGKLPKDARNALLDWWNTHNRWPYPTVISSTSIFGAICLRTSPNYASLDYIVGRTL